MRSSYIVLLCSAGVLLSAGTILGSATTWSILRMSYYFWLSDLGIELGAGVLLSAGGLLCVPAAWMGVLVPQNPRPTTLLATLMLVSSTALLMLSLGMSSLGTLSRATREPAYLNASLLSAMSRTEFEPAVRSAFATMQLELRCCGVQSYVDWMKLRNSLPAACCNRWPRGKQPDVCEEPLFTNGCLQQALLELRYYINSMSILAAAVIVTLSAMLFASAYALVVEAEESERSKRASAPLLACISSPAHAQLLPYVPNSPPQPQPQHPIPARN